MTSPTFAEAIADYVTSLDARTMAAVVRDEIAEHTARMAIAMTPNAHPSRRPELLAEAAATLGDYAELAVACTLERIACGIALATVVR
jgi:hypothetical protein